MPGNQVNATVTYTGYTNGGLYPDVRILDAANGSKVWSNCIYSHTEHAGGGTNGTASYYIECDGRHPAINKTGSYIMVSSYEGHTARAPFSVSGPGTARCQDVSVLSAMMVPPFTPGGPIIQITLQNLGTVPITGISAALEMHYNYTFSFANVTTHSPLQPKSYASGKAMLIGGGFETDVSYPLALGLTAGDIQTSCVKSIHIHG